MHRNRHAALLFSSLLAASDKPRLMAEARLADAFGPFLMRTPCMDWGYSDYYEAEFGPGLKRSFLVFARLIRQEDLGGVKHKTIEIERELSADGKRLVNIDPGYVTEAKVVLASTKDYAHRIPIGDGVFAEVTLYHMHGTFRPHLFTYRDYAEAENIALFEKMRKVFKGLVSRC